jgi:predicted GNAT superfamily acetyltransferase
MSGNAAVSRQIVPIAEEAWERLLELNNRQTTETSPLGGKAWARLLEHAFHGRMVDGAEGFVIALDQGAPYANVNHGWFRARYDRFVYVDRIVVDPAVRRQGLARLLYHDLFAHAREVGHEVVTCEINAKPANPGSDAMHAALGFREVGTATFPETGKHVRYLVMSLRDHS